MSEKLIAVTTQIGKQKAFNAELEGVKIKITHIAVGDGAYTPSETQTALQNEKDRIPILSSKIDPENFLINFGAIIDNDKKYWVNEIGFYLDDGTLFAVWSHPTIRLGEKTPINKFLFGYSLQLVDVGLDKIEIVDMGVDLTLNYAQEFLSLGVSVMSLNNIVLNLSDKVKQSILDCDDITKKALLKVDSIKKEFDKTIDAELKRLEEAEQNFADTREEITASSIVQASAIIEMQGLSVEQKLESLKHLTDEQIHEALKALENKDRELSAEYQQLKKELVEQRENLLLPVLANANGVVSIQNILVKNELKGLE